MKKMMIAAAAVMLMTGAAFAQDHTMKKDAKMAHKDMKHDAKMMKHDAKKAGDGAKVEAAKTMKKETKKVTNQ